MRVAQVGIVTRPEGAEQRALEGARWLWDLTRGPGIPSALF